MITYIFLFFQKLKCDISCKVFLQETICMNCQTIFSENKNEKNQKKYFKLSRLLKFLSSMLSANTPLLRRVRTRIFFSFATIFANLIFFVPFSLTLSQILSQILAIFRQRIILSEKRCSFTDSFDCSNTFKSQYNVKCVGDLKLNLTLIFKTSAVIN